jgi:hypothetical protein
LGRQLKIGGLSGGRHPARKKVTKGRLAGLAAVLAVAATAVVVPLSAGANSLIRLSQLTSELIPSGSTALGAVPSSQSLSLRVVLPPSNTSNLDLLLASLYNPASPTFHQFLAPGQFDAEFGPSTSTVDAVTSWLHSVGLNATLSGFALDVSAPAGQIAAALGTTLERYQTVSGLLGFVATAAPLVPSSLANGQIVSILGLNSLDQLRRSRRPPPANTPLGKQPARRLRAQPAARASPWTRTALTTTWAPSSTPARMARARASVSSSWPHTRPPT